MEPKERYRDKAIECTSAADHTHDAGERVKLLAIAKLFMNLAEHVTARLERGPSIDRTINPANPPTPDGR
jgi:hypothetical protein